ncbi:MAG: AMP-binding protein [Nitrospira sp.]
MSDVRDHIKQARDASGRMTDVPWGSFAEFFRSRVYDPQLATRNVLTFCDDERRLRRTYTYAELGAIVERLAGVFHTRFGVTRGDRVATLLFNHDVTVLTYFAAWTLGVAVVPINMEETPEKKRYILEHSEVSTVFCWKDGYEELCALQSDIPTLRHVIALGDAGVLDSHRTGKKGLRTEPLARFVTLRPRQGSTTMR